MIERIIADDLPARMLFLGRHPKLHIRHFGIDVLGWRVRSFFSSARLSCLLRPQDSRVSFVRKTLVSPFTPRFAPYPWIAFGTCAKWPIYIFLVVYPWIAFGTCAKWPKW